MGPHRYLLIAILALALVIPNLMQRTPSIAQGPPAAAPPVAAELQGTISCATSICHGGASLREPRSEATTWRAVDPHARAYDTLLSDASRKIAGNLWPDSKKLAHQEKRCLTCHVHPAYDHAHPTRNVRPNFRKEDGVGCESCHGAAQHWLSPHYTSEWKKHANSSKASLGLADTKNLAVRAGVCVSCHVGTPGTDAHVDHDLIAAGHPPLRFEFATYFTNLPAHWNVDADRTRNSSNTKVDFETRAWAVGQLVTSARALELLADRAAHRVWPEFAELDCFACHHDLQGSSKKPRHGNRKPGELMWNQWHYALLPELLPDEALVQSFKARREPLRRSDLFAQDGRKELAARATELAKTLAGIAQTRADVKQPDPCFSIDWLNRLRKDASTEQNWDEATQRYFALLAVREMHKDAELDRLIADLSKKVAFRSGWNGPRDEHKK